MIHAPRCLSLLLVAALLAPTASAFADAPAEKAGDKQLATDLFDKANKKLEEGKCDQPAPTNTAVCLEARDLFRRAYEIYPAGLGALRNLAYVELNLGLLASAARNFRELERRAPDDPNPKRHVWAEYAHKELETLEPRVPHVTLMVPKEHPATLKVTLDGLAIPEPAWGTALDVDPGKHTLRADTGSCPAFELTLDVAEKESRSVDVAFCAPQPVEAPSRRSLDGSRVPALVFMGVGGVTLVAGLIFGVSAISKKSDACGDSNVCDRQGLDDARTAASTSTILTGVGLALTLGGAAWYYFGAPKAKAEPARAARVAPWAGPSGFGLTAMGSF